MSASMDEKKDDHPSESGNNIIFKLARPNILSLQPYRCARDDYSEGILLDANENAFGPPYPPKEENTLHLERYPDPYQIPLKSAYAAYRSDMCASGPLLPKNIFVGVGSDEAIDLLLRCFCKPSQDSILITPPTYGMYQVCANINDVGIIKVPLTPGFDVQIEQTLAAETPQTKLLFLCSPGNPTCKAIPLSTVAHICGSFSGIVVVDEAYIDFCDASMSALNLLHTFDNLVVLQTMSKAFGLAGIRLGYAISGNSDLIQLMNNVKAPYNINQLTSDLALKALTADHTFRLKNELLPMILEQRTKVMEALESLEFVTQVFPSDANFILFRVKHSAHEIYKRMADEGGVVSRYRGNELHCKECIRVTVGTPEENQAFLSQLALVWNKVNDHHKSNLS